MIRHRLAALALVAAFAVALMGTSGAPPAQARVVQPHLPALAKEPAVARLNHFLHVLRRRHHASPHVWRHLRVRKRHYSSAARDALEARDHERKSFLKAYLAKPGRRHPGRIERDSLDYYAFLRNNEAYDVRQILARISNQMDRLAYS
jgi:hypothetical protein